MVLLEASAPFCDFCARFALPLVTLLIPVVIIFTVEVKTGRFARFLLVSGRSVGSSERVFAAKSMAIRDDNKVRFDSAQERPCVELALDDIAYISSVGNTMEVRCFETPKWGIYRVIIGARRVYREYRISCCSPEKAKEFAGGLSKASKLFSERHDSKLHLIVNPVSGAPGTSLQVVNRIEAVLRAANQPYIITITTARGHAKRIGMSWNSAIDGDCAICVGGDGLLHEFINGVMIRRSTGCKSGEPLIAVVAAGSGNGVAKSLGFDVFDVESSTLAILKRKVTPFDLMSCQFSGCDRNECAQPVYSIASVQHGIIADVDYKSERFRFMGSIRFHLEAILQIFIFRPVCISLSAQNATRNLVPGSRFDTLGGNISKTGKWTNIMVSNVPYITHDMKFAPLAHHCNGTADLVTLGNVRRWPLLWDIFLRVEDGAHINTETAKCHGRIHRITSIQISPGDTREQPARVMYDIDGEFFWSSGAVVIKVVPGAINVICA